MTDLTITAADVVASDTALLSWGTAGETVTAGQPVYRDALDSNRLKPADVNSGNGQSETPVGIALCSSSASQPLAYITGGDLTLTAVMTIGETYVASNTPGGIAPIGDLTTNDVVAHLGVASSTSVLKVNINASQIEKP